MMFFDETWNLITVPLRKNGEYTQRLQLNTMCFHTFFLMNWFNTLNCRIIDKDDLNIFHGINENLIFWIVMALEMFIQHVMITAGEDEFGSKLLETAPLTPLMTIIAWVFGALTLVVNVIIK